MKVCGIEISSNEAVVVVLEKTGDEIEMLNTSVKKITLSNDEKQSAINSFKNVILNFLKDNDVENVAIKQRAQSGKFSGGALSFKMEALIQLYEKEVKIINGSTINSKTKNLNLTKYKINKYQEEALKAALAIL